MIERRSATSITKKRKKFIDILMMELSTMRSYVHYTTESKDKAKKLYEQAVQGGKFK